MTVNQFRFGFKVNGARVGDVSRLLNWVQAAKPAWMTVLNNIDLCQQIYDVSAAQTNVIDRFYDPREGGQWRTDDPYQYAESKRDGRAHIWKYILNEPSTKTLAETQQRNDWLTVVANELVKHGYRGIIGNFAQGDIELDHIEAGAYDNLLRLLAQFPNQLKLGYHEYTGLLLPMTRFGWYPDMYEHPEFVQSEDWLHLDHADIRLRLPDYRERVVPEFTHLWRWSWLEHRCFALTGKYFGVVHTEFGHDRMVDWEQQSNPNIYQRIESKWGVNAPYSILRGAYSHKNIYRAYYPDKPFNDVLLAQWQWYEANANEWVEGICPFMWSFGDEWDGFGFNYGADEILLNDLVEWSSERQTLITVDILDYMLGDGRLYAQDYYFPGHAFEHGTIHHRTELTPQRFFHVKGHTSYPDLSQWEELWYDNTYIWRGTDVSPNDTEYYQIRENFTVYGARWIKRHMQIGERYEIASWVTFRNKADGSPVNGKPEYLFKHSIELKKVHPVYQFQSNLTLPDVLELWGYRDDGVNFEQYFYAKNYGLVAWNNPLSNWESWLSEYTVHGTIHRQLFPAIQLPALPDLPPKESETPDMDLIFDVNDPRWQFAFITPKGDFVNIRPEPNTTKPHIHRIHAMNHALLMLDNPELNGGYTWYPVRFASVPDADFTDKSQFSISGWLAIEVADYELYEPVDDNSPSEVRVFKYYIPSAEVGLTRTEAQDIAAWLYWFVGQIDGMPGETLEHTRNWITWNAGFIANFHDMIENHDAIMVFEKEETP